MTHSNSQRTKTALFGAVAVIFALGATQAYAADPDDDQAPIAIAKVTTYEKVAVSASPSIIRKEIVPPRPVIQLDTKVQSEVDKDAKLQTVQAGYKPALDLREFDLVEDSPLFIGAPGVDQYDTLDAQRESGRYPQTLNVDPLFTVAGAGVATSF